MDRIDRLKKNLEALEDACAKLRFILREVAHVAGARNGQAEQAEGRGSGHVGERGYLSGLDLSTMKVYKQEIVD